MPRMRHIPLGLALVALALSLSMRSTSAQESSYPFQVGDKINLMYHGHSGQACDVKEIRGQMVRCEQGAKNGEWFNLAITLGIDTRR
jgi:hypothetical protein